MLQMASQDMEMRVRTKLGLTPDQQQEWCYKPCDFNYAVRQLDVDGDKAVLGKGINGNVT